MSVGRRPGGNQLAISGVQNAPGTHAAVVTRMHFSSCENWTPCSSSPQSDQRQEPF